MSVTSPEWLTKRGGDFRPGAVGNSWLVLLSGEPQGGIKMRRRAPAGEFGYARSRDRLPFWPNW